jgi:hypothetical protein
VRLVFTGIASVELQSLNWVPEFVKIVHPAGKPVCCAVGKKITEAGTWIIGLSFACGTAETGPVFPMVTTISIVPPVATIPEFDGNTFIKGLACPNELNFVEIIIVKITNNCFNIFIRI